MIEDVVTTASVAADALESLGREGRARLLERLGDALEADAAALVTLASTETALPPGRLAPEITRTSNQLRLFADVIREGSYLGVTIDEADPTATPPRSELRRIKVPIGPVAVFEASNFPFAFGVLGGDTASALAAGCPVVVKVHPAHASASRAVGAITAAVLESQGLPPGILQLVEGLDIGLALVTAEKIAAVGFTGSARGGAAIERAIGGRRHPIPFYGELGSINPIVITPDAARTSQAEEVGAQIADSVLTAFGQLCTKPGLVLVPSGSAGDGIVSALRARIKSAGPFELISPTIADAFRASTGAAPVGGRTVGATFDEVAVDSADAATFEERFGPAALALRYDSSADIDTVFRAIGGQLTASVLAASGDDPDARGLLEAASRIAGRVLYNAMPTGVAVSWSQQHGGPRPATTAPWSTSVGANAIDRWLRPITYQNLPAELLPEDLANPTSRHLPYRLNGVLNTADH